MKWDSVSTFINLGMVDIVCGLLAIAFQAGVTYLCQDYSDTFNAYGEFINLGLSSCGIWIGGIYMLTGFFGIFAGIRRKKPAVGTAPARKSYHCLTVIFAFMSVSCALLSIVLIGISAAMGSNWLKISVNETSIRSNDLLLLVATPIAVLSFFLVLIGLIQLPMTIISSYKACGVSRRDRKIGKIVFYTGPPTMVSHVPHSHQKTQPQVISRPASEVFTVSTPASSIDYFPRSSLQSIPGSISQKPEIYYDF